MNPFAPYRSLVRNRALVQLLAGEFISGIGDWLYLVAILVVIYAETQSPVLLGILGAARILPYVLLSVPAGMVADRFDRRLVLLVTDVARGVLMLLLALVVAVDAPVAFVVGGAIAAACFSTFFNPAIAALIPSLVDERDLGAANSAWATLDNLSFIIGPALAGILLATGGLTLAFLLNAASFAVVAVVLWRLPVPPRPVRADGGEGAEPEPAAAGVPWRSLARPLSGPFLLDSVTSFVGGGLGVLTVIIAFEVIGAGEAGTGYLNAAVGVGGVVAGIAAGSLVARRLSVPLLVGGIVAGVGLAFLGFSGELLPAMLGIGVGVAGALLLEVVNTTLIQRTVPDRMRGRAIGLLQTSSALLYSAGSLLFPILASLVGVSLLLFGAGVAVAGAAVAALLLTLRVAQPAPLDPVRQRMLRLPIFAGLPSARLEAAARSAEEVPVVAGEVIVRQGDPADRFYVIADGRFAVSQRPPRRRREVELRQLGADDVFGEIGLLERSPRTATVTALTDGLLLALPGDEFLELVGSGPGLSTRLLDLYRGALART